MKTLVSIELGKLFRKWRTYIGFIAIGALTPIIQYAIYAEGDSYLNFFTQNLQNSFYMSGNLLNGYLIGYLILQALLFHIPFLVVLVGGDLLASEATMGTYRMILTRPVSRFKILTSKYIAGFIYTTLLIGWLAFLSLFVSILLFGTGDLLVIRSVITIFSSDDVLWRFGMAYLTAIVSMTTVFSISFLFSALVENAIGPIIASMALIIIFVIISAIPIPALESIRPYLFTYYFTIWREFFGSSVDWGMVFQSGLILILHSVGLYLITLFIFIKKDILS
ncbi:MAG: ABC transporter permease [Ignavibacteria bacterium]|nr:MAG: ABC transporter permease [Ignavibacteria bacterium]